MTQLPIPAHAPVIALTRGGHIESVHYGSYLVLSPDGTTASQGGDPSALVYARSSLKPLQTIALLTAGWAGTPQQITLASASHSGEQQHLDVTTTTLHDAGLTIDALRNTPDLPMGEESRNAARAAGVEPTSLMQNCSGKHAAMLATCVANGWDTETYLNADHPLQQHIRATLETLCGEQAAAVTTDGCGAPLFLFTLHGLAQGFHTIARTAHDEPTSPHAQVYKAITRHPELLGGTGRDVTDMMQTFPGLMTKDGAEAVHAGVFADGSTFALKISDGTNRGRVSLALHLLKGMGHDNDALTTRHLPTVLGHGQPVGEIIAL
ncbi:asparaginase [Jonesia quinghaiensis]|uniref:asparaginase n=1 Tax=Jonesia quinghaiensis TaxID=262806 RepID=UPI0003F96204|nr:asparaginase [Jonesia quinghaiensis]